ncbi:MAG: hypothetical protein PF569_07710 [Candidatus Woesearchaeota archaeon]|jgi:hypothetical protein|nr:hypothetical protein [Candidatus Woesearchaeota archaeon]
MNKINNEFNHNIIIGDKFKEDLSKIFKNLNISNREVLLFLGRNYFKVSQHYQEFIDLQEDCSNQILEIIFIDENPKEIETRKFINKYEYLMKTVYQLWN